MTSALCTHLENKHEINLQKRTAAESVAGSNSRCDKVNHLTKIIKYFKNTKNDSPAAILARIGYYSKYLSHLTILEKF